MPKKILIVDDEKLVTETLAGMLQLRGYQVLQAFDGETALARLKDSAPDLVLLDMKLPGIDGLEVLKTIRKDYPGMFVVVTTGYDSQYKKKVDQIGSDGFFVKPVLVSDIKEKIEALFSKGAAPTIGSKTTATLDKEPVVNEKDLPEDKIIPKAKILLIEPREMLVGLLEEYFSNKECTQAEYEIKWFGMVEDAKHLDSIHHFQPDIILFDVALVGLFGEFAASLMDFPYPPKEIILFGDPAMKWEEADNLIKRGLAYVATPLDPKYMLPDKEILEKLSDSLKRACIKHKLYREI
ncbi:MAG: response regulator [Candidatus Omnitrophota bacterium]|jgi:DNA-binding response OmpR family regulator|nr:MAG: response regulator [Candidatus Omnitrophota bacterium]